MRPDDVRELLGGYATGTLTEQERKRLFEAALDDQRLFDALADEEALRELLADPAYRSELAVALEEKPTVSEKLTAWWRRPLPLALAGGVAAMAIALVILTQGPESGAEFQNVTVLRQQPEVSPLKEALESGAPAENPPPGTARYVSSQDAALSFLDDVRKKNAALQEENAASASPPPMASSVAKEPAAQEAKNERPADIERMDEMPARLARRKSATASGREFGARSEQDALTEVRNQPVAAGFTAEAEKAEPVIAAFRDVAGERGSLRVAVLVQSAQGNYEELAANRSPSLTDAVRLQVDTPGAGYLLVSERAEGAEMPRTLFSGAAAFGRPNYIPTNGGLPGPSGPGPRTLIVVFSPEPFGEDGRRRSLSYFEGSGGPDEPMLIERVSINYR